MAVIGALKQWARLVKRDVIALWLATRDPRVPWYAKALAAAVAAYALSPIDLIPDFIPILGHLDDVIIVPLGIALADKLVPAHLMDQSRAEADRRAIRPPSAAGLFMVTAVWAVAAAGLVLFFWPMSPS